MPNLREKARIIFRNPFFEGFTTAERIEFIRLCHRRSYRQGEFIYHQGDPGTGMYFIESGSVSLSVADDPKSGEAQKIRELGTPDSFGIMAPDMDIRRPSSAMCMTDCVLYGFFQPDFDTLKRRHPKTAVNVLQSLTRNILLINTRLTERLVEQVGRSETYRLHLTDESLTREDIDGRI